MAVPIVKVNMTTISEDPYPVFEEIRARGPVVFNEFDQMWIVTSFIDCRRVLGETQYFNNSGQQGQMSETFGGLTMEALDDQRHDDIRAIWADDFNRARLVRERTGVVRRIAGSQIERFAAALDTDGAVDAAHVMTRGIPTMVIAQMMGIPLERLAEFTEWSDQMSQVPLAQFDPSDHGRRLAAEGRAATKSMNAFLADQIEERRADSRSDLISTMVNSPFARTHMGMDEVVANNSLLIFAGNETTAMVMATILVTLATYPDVRRALTRERAMIPNAIEEIMRWQTTSQMLVRSACSDESEVAGKIIPKGDSVLALMAAGNRDPDRWDEPEKFIPTRPFRANLGFGFGRHQCLGQSLTRVEVLIWLNMLLDTVPDFELAGPVVYSRNPMIRGPVSVPLARCG